MPVSMGTPGFSLSLQERIGMLVAMVGGPVKAAHITGRTRSTIDNIRKPDAALRLDDMLALATAAGVSLDWVATGYQWRPDLLGKPSVGPSELEAIQPLVEGESLTLALPTSVLAGLGLSVETARVARADDDGMAPSIRKGAMLIVDIRPAKIRSGLYLLWDGEEHLARRLMRSPRGTAELLADASPAWRYPAPEEADGRHLARVVWWGQEA